MNLFYLFLFYAIFILGGNDLALCQQSPNLNCVDFDNACAWHNCQTPAAPLMWYRSTANISTDQMLTTTGTNAVPNGSYAIGSSTSMNESLHACLISDLVPSQPNNGSLTFNYWTSPFVLLKVCQKVSQIPLNWTTMCQKTPLAQGPGPANITIAASLVPFQIVIGASNFVFSNGILQGGFAIIDNFQYNNGSVTNATTNSGNLTSANSTGTNGNATVTSGNFTVTTGNSTVPMGVSTVAITNSTSASLVQSSIGSASNNQSVLQNSPNSTNPSTLTTSSSSTG